MTYKLNPALNKIQSPVVLIFPEGNRQKYSNGAAVTDMAFDKKYLVASMIAINSSIEITLEEPSINEINWIGEEAVSFF